MTQDTQTPPQPQWQWTKNLAGYSVTNERRSGAVAPGYFVCTDEESATTACKHLNAQQQRIQRDDEVEADLRLRLANLAERFVNLEGALREKAEQRQLWADMAKELDNKLTAAKEALREAEAKAVLLDDLAKAAAKYIAAMREAFSFGGLPHTALAEALSRYDALQQPKAGA